MSVAARLCCLMWWRLATHFHLKWWLYDLRGCSGLIAGQLCLPVCCDAQNSLQLTRPAGQHNQCRTLQCRWGNGYCCGVCGGVEE